MKKNLLIVVGPTGVGKSTLLDKALKEYPQLFDTTTYTTRSMRQGESEGSPYHFVSKERFEELIQKNFFVEWAKVHSNLYGTPLHQLEDAWKAGKTVIMDVDVQGAKTFLQHFPQARTVFILPPSIDVLRQRVAKRDSKAPADLELRLQNAVKEIALAPTFHQQIVNDNFDTAYAALKKIIEDLLKSR